MTAAGAAPDELREALTAHRMVAGSNRGVVCRCGWTGRGLDFEEHAADALLPVVTAYAEDRARQRAAEELRVAADTYDEAWPGIDPVSVDLRNRADALDGGRS